MTILDATLCMVATFCIGYFVCMLYLAAPLLQRISRLIGKLNQKEWQIMHWQLAYNKANGDFMKLAEIHNSVITPKGELNDC